MHCRTWLLRNRHEISLVLGMLYLCAFLIYSKETERSWGDWMIFALCMSLLTSLAKLYVFHVSTGVVFAPLLVWWSFWLIVAISNGRQDAAVSNAVGLVATIAVWAVVERVVARITRRK